MKSKLRFYFFMCSLCVQDQLDFDKLYSLNPMTIMVKSEFKFEFYTESTRKGQLTYLHFSWTDSPIDC